MNSFDFDDPTVSADAAADPVLAPTWRLPAGHRAPGQGPRPVSRPLEIRLALSLPAPPVETTVDHCFVEEALRLGVRIATPDAADAWRVCHRPMAGRATTQASGLLALDTLERLAEQPGPQSRTFALFAALAAKW